MNEPTMENIPLHMIDEPTDAMRSDVWGEDLDDLARSIEQLGLLQPVTLRARHTSPQSDLHMQCARGAECLEPNHMRYEVIAGHRRLSAFRKLGKASIPSIVREADDVTGDAMKVHENLYRTDVNPVDQATFLARYAMRTNMTPAELAKQVNRSEAWVLSRLNLLNYPEYLVEMVGGGRLSMASAEILNQIENPAVRESYCRAAAQQGLSATRAKYWLAQSQLGRLDVNNIVIEPVPEGAPAGTPAVLKFRCVFDGQEYPADGMISVFCNPDNLNRYKDALALASVESEPVA